MYVIKYKANKGIFVVVVVVVGVQSRDYQIFSDG